MEKISEQRAGWKRYCFFGLFVCLMIILAVTPASGFVIGTGTQQTGSIMVSSVPYRTTLSLDNRQVGVTPTVLSGITPGTHTVLLTSPGYLPFSQQVTVQAGSVSRVYAILLGKPQENPTTGTIRVSSSPTNANVYIDDRLTGVTPTTVDGISGGQHKILLSKQGFNDYTAQITVTNGTVTDFYAVLEPKPVTTPPAGSIRIISTPSMASVYLDNRLNGVSPETINGISPGQHQVRILKPGYLGVTKNVTVVDNQITTLNVVLTVNPSIFF